MRMHNPEACARERQVLERQVGHMARLVNDLLDVASLARGKVALRVTRCEVSQVIDRAVDMARPLIDRHRHRLLVDVPASGLPLDGDEDRLVQVLTNLLTNAAKYTPQGGRISLTARREDHAVVIACEDDGPGLTADLAETLFDPFAQGPRTIDRAQGGLGLGLALARSLTTLHGGTLRFETPASGAGSRFVVRLPLAIGGPPDAARTAPAPHRPAEAGRRVLVVDDNVDACEMLRVALEGAGHEVQTALDGPEAERVARRFQPAVAIVDIGLPGMDGYELALRLRQVGREMRLIALTGYGQPSDVEAAARAGFDKHFTKPVEVTVLLDELESVSVGRT
jgi:CheY-like chemotaxis protein/two-component sensor histidine kinase